VLSKSTRARGSRRELLAPPVALLLLGVACGGRAASNVMGAPAPSGSGSGGEAHALTGGGGGALGAGGLPAAFDAAGTSSDPGSAGTSTSGAGTGGGLLATAGEGGDVSASGSGGGVVVPHPTPADTCLAGYGALASDDTMEFGPHLVTLGDGRTDTTMQAEVLQWLSDNRWPGAHAFWHGLRGCVDGSAASFFGPLGFPNICKDYPVLVPQDQNCKTSGDGYQFLLLHRYLLQTMRQLWPKHAADFAGFSKFPTRKAELPVGWNASDPKWSAQILAAADIADHIEQHLDQFPNEGALGFWLQCPVGTPALPEAPQLPSLGLHPSLHAQWSRGANSAHGLDNEQVNVSNYLFWKLHGWIDDVWERYRVAKGLTKPGSPEMAAYNQNLRQQCNEFSGVVAFLTPSRPGPTGPLDCLPDPNETGYFHDNIRPLFATDVNHCASCHGAPDTSPYANLTLGGQTSSRCLVERLKRPSNDGGQFKLIEPGDPDKSWLYLKPSGKAENSGCFSVDPDKPCNTATMPPSGKTMTDSELEILRKWIADGALYP